MGINEYDKAPPTVERLDVFDRYTEIPAIDYGNYGEGLCRRRIRLENISDSFSIGELEDDFHHFRVEIHHNENRVTHIQGTTFRAPWSTCSEVNKPLQEIVGLQLSRDSISIGAHVSPTDNCTHLFDLTGLLASHTHQVPHIGLPHKEPVTRANNVKLAPIGAEAFAARSARGCFQMRATALATARNE